MSALTTLSGPALDQEQLIGNLLDQGAGLLSARIAAWVISRGPIKAVARQVGIGPDTLRAWRGGRGVSGANIEVLADAYGAPFIEYVFAPWLVDAEASALARLDKAEAELAALRRLLIAEQEKDSHDAGFAGDGSQGVGRCGGAAGSVGTSPTRRSRRARSLGVVLMLAAALVGMALAVLVVDDGMPARISRMVRIQAPRDGRVFRG